MNHKFAISVPVGAYHPLLRDCLKSLAIQDPRPQVALLDASGDPRVKGVADEFDDVINYRRHGPDNGQSAAILEGWRNLDGDLLGWLNADDTLYPNAVAKASKCFLDRPSVDIVYGHSVIIDDDGSFKGYHWAVEPPSERIMASAIISQPSCFFRREAYDAIGGLDKDLHYTMDWDLWIRFWRNNAEFAFIDDVLSRVLWTKDAKTGGFGVERRRELERLIQQNTSSGFLARLKTRIGFGLNHLFEYLLPGNLTRLIRRRVAALPNSIHGLGSNGEITSCARLPLVHYDNDEPHSIDVAFAHDANSVSVEIEGMEARVSRERNIAHIEFLRPLPAGLSANLIITNNLAKPAMLSSVDMR